MLSTDSVIKQTAGFFGGGQDQLKQKLRSGITDAVQNISADQLAEQAVGGAGPAITDFRSGTAAGISKGISDQVMKDPAKWKNFKYPLMPALISRYLPGGDWGKAWNTFQETGGFGKLLGIG